MKNLMHAFEILKVEPGSDDATLRKAWRALVRTYHPDMAKADPESANRRLAEINAAWDLVSSSTQDDIQRLKEMMDQRVRAAQRRRKAMEERRAQEQAAFKAAEDARTQTQARAQSEETDKTHKAGQAAGTAQNKGAAAQHGKNDSHTADAFGRTQIAMLARRAFQTAQVVCSSELRSAARPLYM